MIRVALGGVLQETETILALITRMEEFFMEKGRNKGETG
jgi:hypothetical protein